MKFSSQWHFNHIGPKQEETSGLWIFESQQKFQVNDNEFKLDPSKGLLIFYLVNVIALFTPWRYKQM